MAPKRLTPDVIMRAVTAQPTLDKAARVLGIRGPALRARVTCGVLRDRWFRYVERRKRRRNAAKQARKRARHVLRAATRVRGTLSPLWMKRIRRALGHLPERERPRWAYLGA